MTAEKKIVESANDTVYNDENYLNVKILSSRNLSVVDLKYLHSTW